MDEMGLPWIIAHRGALGLDPENTQAVFARVRDIHRYTVEMRNDGWAFYMVLLPLD
jgi:hypothetical protein